MSLELTDENQEPLRLLSLSNLSASLKPYSVTREKGVGLLLEVGETTKWVLGAEHPDTLAVAMSMYSD